MATTYGANIGSIPLGTGAGSTPPPSHTQAYTPTDGSNTDILNSGTQGGFNSDAVQHGFQKAGQAQDWVNKNINDPSTKVLGSLPVVGGVFNQLNSTGVFAPTAATNTAGAMGDANAARNGFASAFGNMTPMGSPTMQGATINTGQSDQSRQMAQGGFNPMAQGLGVQGLGAGIQQSGLGAQQAGIGIQSQGLGALGMGLGAQQQGLGAQQTGMNTLGNAQQSYQDVLSGRSPSVASLTAQKLQGQTVGSMFGGAASARGVDRAGALRAAINGSGAVNAQGAADAAINQAQEQNMARSGLAGIGGAQVGAGSAMSGTGAQMGGIGQGISGIGQGITAGGQGISATGAGLANTGSGMVNTGTQMGNLGLGIRGQDQTGAFNQATLDQGAATNNLNAATTTAGQNVTRENNLGQLTLGAQNSENTAADNADKQALENTKNNQKNGDGVTGMVSGLLGSIF